MGCLGCKSITLGSAIQTSDIKYCNCTIDSLIRPQLVKKLVIS